MRFKSSRFSINIKYIDFIDAICYYFSAKRKTRLPVKNNLEKDSLEIGEIEGVLDGLAGSALAEPEGRQPLRRATIQVLVLTPGVRVQVPPRAPKANGHPEWGGRFVF